jgi:hypothetical protein
MANLFILLIFFLLLEDDLMLLLGTEELEQLQACIQELITSDADIHLNHLVEDRQKILVLPKLEGWRAEVDIGAIEFIVRRRREFGKNLVYTFLLQVRNQVI